MPATDIARDVLRVTNVDIIILGCSCSCLHLRFCLMGACEFRNDRFILYPVVRIRGREFDSSARSARRFVVLLQSHVLTIFVYSA